MSLSAETVRRVRAACVSERRMAHRDAGFGPWEVNGAGNPMAAGCVTDSQPAAIADEDSEL